MINVYLHIINHLQLKSAVVSFINAQMPKNWENSVLRAYFHTHVSFPEESNARATRKLQFWWMSDSLTHVLRKYLLKLWERKW